MSLPQTKRLRIDGSGKRQRQRILGEKWRKNNEKLRRSKKESKKEKSSKQIYSENARKFSVIAMQINLDHRNWA